LSIDKNERKGDSDEPDAPLLLERELAVGEVDVVIGRKQSDQANNCSNDGFQQGFAIEPQPPPGRRLIQIPEISSHPKQPDSIPNIRPRIQPALCPTPAHPTFLPSSPAATPLCAALW
jgi:hypothetical protein